MLKEERPDLHDIVCEKKETEEPKTIPVVVCEKKETEEPKTIPVVCNNSKKKSLEDLSKHEFKFMKGNREEEQRKRKRSETVD